jgi:hypothetical protein
MPSASATSALRELQRAERRVLAPSAYVKPEAAVCFHRRVEAVDQNDEMVETRDHLASINRVDSPGSRNLRVTGATGSPAHLEIHPQDFLRYQRD